MLEFMTEWILAAWHMVLDSSLYFVAGLLIAGLLSTVLNARTITSLMGGSRISAIGRAALVGIPLPLCSCSVLPVADQLRKAGLKRGPVAAFLISTPESGADSILLTYSLTDPVLTVARPISAFLTSFAAGMIQRDETPSTEARPSTLEPNTSACDCQEQVQPRRWWQRIWDGLEYTVSDLIADLAPYLLVGFLTAGLVEALFGSSLMALSSQWKTGVIGYLGAIVSGLPLYICATSSTPLAAVLLGYGFSPGAVLVFLLVGPATNIASLVVVKRILGLAGTLKYLAALVVVSITCGMLTDLVYGLVWLEPVYRTGEEAHESGTASTIAAIALVLLILYWTSRKIVRRFI
ncbi:MAG: permease [Candidatus Zixiibacteriota bacterium]|nr:MAG: permease [candidate division Zixibacteria bacterium]